MRTGWCERLALAERCFALSAEWTKRVLAGDAVGVAGFAASTIASSEACEGGSVEKVVAVSSVFVLTFRCPFGEGG